LRRRCSAGTRQQLALRLLLLWPVARRSTGQAQTAAALMWMIWTLQQQ
jgi:hypothetical protein